MQLKKLKELDDWKIAGIFFFRKEFVRIYIFEKKTKPQLNETSKLKFIFLAFPLLCVFLLN